MKLRIIGGIGAAVMLLGVATLGIVRGSADEAEGPAFVAQVVRNIGMPHGTVREAMDAAKAARDNGSPQSFEELVAANLDIEEAEVRRSIEEARRSIGQNN